MKKIFTIVIAVLLTASVFAQTPEKMSYQAVIRDASNNLVTNQTVGMQISILQGSANGTVVYTETQTPTTNTNGLVSIEIGGGAGFSTIDWANGSYFIKTETDLTGGASYTITGTSQLLSVPYALHSKTAETVTGTITETDPVFNAWDKDYTDLTNTPTIPTVPANVSEFTNDAGYLTEYSETDPEFTAWDKTTGITITESQISDLQTYLTTEVDGSVTNEIQNLSQVLTQSNDAGMQIKDVSNPTDAQDAATKTYVDQMMQIMENNGLTVVDFTADTIIITVDSTVNFTDNSAINPTTWAWDFGDGNTATTQNPTHSYASRGTYTVSLTADNGIVTKTESKTNYITVRLDGPGAGLTDYDGNNYTSIIIGGQEWMSENLKVTHYPNGDPIPLVTDNTAWINLAGDNTSDAYSYYNNNVSSEADTYGALYTYAAAIGDDWARDNVENQGVCPDGWHLPTDAEWTELTDYLGTNAGSKLAGNAALWTDASLDQSADFGTSGFSALPGGYRAPFDDTFYFIGQESHWWSASESGSDAILRNIKCNETIVNRDYFGKSHGYSVRCVRD